MSGAARPLAVGACVCLLGVGAAGCSTTQEKAEHQKAKSEHILKAQAERKKAKKLRQAKRAGHHHQKGGGK